jgi:hypothetical protein
MKTRNGARLLRGFAMGALLAVGGTACAPRKPVAPAPDVFPPFVPDVSDDEWNAAIPAEGSRIAAPHLLAGPGHTEVRSVLKRGETARATLAHIIRADGTVGLYRITASTNPQYTARVIEMMRAQVYEPPLLNGSPVAVRGEVTFRYRR